MPEAINVGEPVAARSGRNWLLAYGRDDVEAISALQERLA